MASISLGELRERIAFLYRNLDRSGFTTKEFLVSIRDRFNKGKRNKDSLWEEWAELRAIAISGATRKKSGLTEDALTAALSALKEEVSVIHVPSIDQSFSVCPASWARINIIEEHEWWLRRLEAAKSILTVEADHGVPNRFVIEKRCTACGGITEPGSLKQLLNDVSAEIRFQRGMILANVVAPTPAPITEPADWVDDVTVVEEELLKQTYHRVNFDVIQQLPDPVSADNQRNLPRSWAFLFQSLEERTHKPAAHFMKNRALASIIATIVLETIKSQAAKDAASDKSKSDKAK